MNSFQLTMPKIIDRCVTKPARGDAMFISQLVLASKTRLGCPGICKAGTEGKPYCFTIPTALNRVLSGEFTDSRYVLK